MYAIKLYLKMVYEYSKKSLCAVQLIIEFVIKIIAGLFTNSGPADGDGPSSVGPVGPMPTLGHMTPARGAPGSIRRGPGRPRLRPAGPGNQGHRTPSGHHHGKRIQRPLPVPLRSHHQLSSVQSKILTSHPTKFALPNAPVNTILPSSSSSSVSAESRPFGFYTQQQTPNRDDRTQNQKH